MDKKKPANTEDRQKVLDSITPEELDKIKAHQASTQGAFPVDTEWLLLAEFAKAYGWQAYLDVKDDKITGAEMLTLIEANRKLQAIQSLKMARDVYIGSSTARSTKSNSTFNSLTRDIVKQTRVHE